MAVHAWVAIHGAETVPEHPGVHTDGGKLTSTIEKTDQRESRTKTGPDAFEEQKSR